MPIKVGDINRTSIIESYVTEILDGMDFDTLYTFAYESLLEKKELLDNLVLENEILETYPELLED